MDPQRFDGYLKVQEDIRALDFRRQQEDRNLKLKLDQDLAKLKDDKAAKIKVYEDDAQSALKTLENEEEEKLAAVKTRQAEELRNLQQRHLSEQEGRAREKERAIANLNGKSEEDRSNLIEVFRDRNNELLERFEKAQCDLRIQRDAEDMKKKDELYQAAREQSRLPMSINNQDVAQLSQSSSSVRTGSPRTTPPARTLRKASYNFRVPSPRRRSRSPRSRARSPYRGRSPHQPRSPLRQRQDRPWRASRGDSYRPMYNAQGPRRNENVRHHDPYSRPLSPRREPRRSRSPRKDDNHDASRGFARSPPRIPTSPRGWDNPPQRPINQGAFDNHLAIPPSSERRGSGQASSSLDTMDRGMGDQLSPILTSPRADLSKRTKGQRKSCHRQMASMGLAFPRAPAVQTPNVPATTSNGNGVNSHNNVPREPPTPAKSKPAQFGTVASPTLVLGTALQTTTNAIGTRPIGRYVIPTARRAPGAIPRFLTHFPVQHVKYTKEDGTPYEWISSTAPPIQLGELRLDERGSYKGYRPKKDIQYPAGWSIKANTVRRLLYWDKFGVIQVVKLKQPDVGPPELWLEFKEPKNEVLQGFLKSFKDLDWHLYRVHPEEGPDTDINPMTVGKDAT